MARSRRKNGITGSGEPRPEPDAPQAGAEAPAPELPPAAAPRAPRPAVDRPAFAETDPSERVYAVVFSRVWLAALGAVSAMRRWSATATDPVRGEILVEARGLLSKTPRPVRITIALDELGLTRVHAAFVDEAGARPEAAEPRPIARFHRHLESLLRRDSRA